MIRTQHVISLIASAVLVVMSPSARAGPAGGVTLSQMTELLGEVALYCGSGPDGEGGPDLAQPCDPATSEIGSGLDTIINTSCATSSNVCVPNVVAEAPATLTITAREIVVDANPACSPTPFDGCEIRIETELRLEDQFGNPIIDMAANGEVFQSLVFARESSCPRGDGDNTADGLRIAEWFPFSTKECVVDEDINFGGALVPDGRNFPILGSAFETSLLQYARTNLGAAPGGVVPLSIVPSGDDVAGKPAVSSRATTSSPAPNELAGTYPVTMRFAQRETALFEIGALDTSGAAFGVVANGSIAYVADGSSGLRVIDISDATAPHEIGSAERNRITNGRDVEMVGSLAYVAVTEGLAIVDVADPNSPAEIGFIDTPDTALNVAVAGSLAYVADLNGGLRIIDVSDSTAPTEIGFFDFPFNSFAWDVAVAGNLAYVADSLGLRIIGVSDPTNPVEIGFIDTLGFGTISVELGGNLAYVGDSLGFRIIDLSDPTNPVEIGFVDTLGRTGSVELGGDLAYVVADSGLRIIDVSDPTNPVEIGFLDTLETESDVTLVGSIAYLTDYGSSLRIIDVFDPTNPVETGSLDLPGSANDVEVVGGFAYVAARGLRVIDITNSVSPAEVGFLEPDSARDVEIGGGLAYVADENAGLRIIDVLDPSNPLEIGSLGTPGFAYDVALAEGFAYVADGLSGLRIIDIADPASPVEIGFVDTLGFASDVELAGNFAYVTANASGLWIIDVADATNPIQIGWVNPPGSAGDVELGGNFAYVAAHDSGLRIIDVVDPASPAEIGSLDAPFSGRDVELSGNLAYVADSFGLQIIDVADPANPTPSDFLPTPGSSGDVDLAGRLVYVADFNKGVRLIGFAPGLDPDLDGLPTILEATLCTDPNDRDTDDDGISDTEEDINLNGVRDPGELDPCDADSDGDGLQDGTEIGMTTGTPDVDGVGPVLATDSGIFIPDADPRTTTDPLNPDTDADGMADGVEDANGNGRVDPGEIDPNANVGSDRVVTLRFSGTYDILGTVFGESGSSVPYQYEIVYDTALDTNSEFFAAGASMNTNTTTHQWYGYSASGIVSASLTFGSKTFPVSSISARVPEAGHSADLWFDTDLRLDSPTRSWIDFVENDGLLNIGNSVCQAGNCFMTSGSSIIDLAASGGIGGGSMSIAEVGTILPGPGWLVVPAILLSGIAGLSGRRPRSFYTRVAAYFGGRARR